MKNVKIIFIALMLIFFGYITISSTNHNSIKKENIELVIFEEESYIDDIPFNTEQICDSIRKLEHKNVF